MGVDRQLISFDPADLGTRNGLVDIEGTLPDTSVRSACLLERKCRFRDSDVSEHERSQLASKTPLLLDAVKKTCESILADYRNGREWLEEEVSELMDQVETNPTDPDDIVL